MSEESKERVYQPDEIATRLSRELPHWRYENGWIRRTFRTSSWKGTLMVINAVGHLAEAAWHHSGYRRVLRMGRGEIAKP